MLQFSSCLSLTESLPFSLHEQDGVTKSGVGWHCKVCDCFLKDSHTYLDHINGRKHQRNLGYSMRVERSTKDQVVSRLERLAKEKEALRKGNNNFDDEEIDYEDAVRAKDEEDRRRKEERKKKRKERKKKLRQQEKEQPQNGDTEEVKETANEEEDDVEDGGVDPAMAAMMGFSGFGGGKKNN